MGDSITLSIGEEYLEKYNEIVKKNYSDKTKQLRKWIDQEYDKIKGET